MNEEALVNKKVVENGDQIMGREGVEVPEGFESGEGIIRLEGIVFRNRTNVEKG